MNNPLRLLGRTFRRRVLQAAAALLCCLVVAPSAFAAEPSGGRMKEIVVSKTPYNTTIQAVIEGPIENYNSFKMDDPFRIVVDVFGVAKDTTVASDIPVDTPQVKGVKISSQDGRIRMIVETPDGKAIQFMANADEAGLSLTVGGGGEEKVSSTDRFQDKDRKMPEGAAVVGIDLEDLPDVANVVITTSGPPDYQISRSGNNVKLTFAGATAEKSLLRRVDPQKFNIPVKSIVPSSTGKATSVSVAFAPGATYTVERKGNSVVVAFAKSAESSPAAEVVARAVTRTRGESRRTPATSAAESPAAAASQAEEDSRWGFLASASSPERKYKGQRISLDFKDAELSNIFRIMAEVSNLNIITTDEVKGKVTVRLINVPWDQALDIILRSKALGATQEGNILRIAPMATIQKEEQERFKAQKAIELAKAEAIDREEETRTAREGVFDIIPVSYSKASELLVKVRPQVSKYGRIDSDDRTNVLIVRDIPSNIEVLRVLVSRLDIAAPQVLIEARIVEIDTTFARELGVRWGGAYRTGANSTTEFGVSGTQTNTGVTNNTGALNLQNERPFGSATPLPTWAVNLPAANGAGTGGGIAFGILRDNLRLDLQLSAMESSGKAKIVSSPKVVTVDNKEALIEQGTQIPYSTVSASGTNMQFIDATLSLKVLPHITPDGRISMQLEAKNDSQGELLGTGQPAINKKKATTEVLIGDGETTVIGGILQVSRTEDQQGLPWLSKIPVLGYFFRRDINNARNRELLIFVTPRILKPEPLTAKAY